MMHRKHKGKIVTCYEYGVLSPVQKLVVLDEETWTFKSNTNDDLMVNFTLLQALDSLSIEGWDLVIAYELGFILRKQIRRHVPVANL